MISKRPSAEILLKASYAGYAGIDAALSQIAPTLSPEELNFAKKAVGKLWPKFYSRLLSLS